MIKHFFVLLVLKFLMLPVESEAQIERVDVIPGTNVSFKMVLIAAGKFTMGSPESDKNQNTDEGPQREVKVDSFWMGIHEVTYDEFVLFEKPGPHGNTYSAALRQTSVDAISRPTPQYIDYTYGMGKSGFPAVSMTQQAALRYCYWLYLKTGIFYRLPTEAEWEYACKAGQTDKLAKGKLDKHAWFYKNSKEKYHEPGLKLPNTLGIYDLLGNVAEWTLDNYDKDYFKNLTVPIATNPWLVPERRHSRTVKGGSYESSELECRCSFRLKSESRWQARDPQIPKSKWWNTDSPFVGFRIISPVIQPSREEVEAFFGKAIID